MTIGRVTLAQAKREAYEALAFLQAGNPTLLERIQGKDNTIAELVAKMPVSATYNTAKSNRSLDKKIIAQLGGMTCLGLTVAHCAKFVEDELATGRARSAQALRSRLFAVCKRGQQLGWLESNPAEPTMKPEAKTRRERLTMDQFKAILAKAPEAADWLSGAMLVALLSGMDRDTLAKLERKAIGTDALTILRGKTKVWIEIPLHIRMDAMDMTLRDAIAACRSNVVSKYVIHHRKTYRKEVKAGSAVFVDRITKAFAEARDLAGITGENAPTFHEIRSLSKRTYMTQGNVDTKALLGHTTDKTAAIYADPRGVEPIRVKVS
ncbi:MAG: tyrosine-type recombinase/integrase [Comamonas sp.]